MSATPVTDARLRLVKFQSYGFMLQMLGVLLVVIVVLFLFLPRPPTLASQIAELESAGAVITTTDASGNIQDTVLFAADPDATTTISKEIEGITFSSECGPNGSFINIYKPGKDTFSLITNRDPCGAGQWLNHAKNFDELIRVVKNRQRVPLWLRDLMDGKLVDVAKIINSLRVLTDKISPNWFK